MSIVLFDDQGQMWDGGSVALRRGFDTPFSGGEFTSYAVRNLGFVAVDLFGRSCQIRLRPARVSQKALVALVEWLAKRMFDRVSLSWFEYDEWQYAIFPTMRDGLDKLTALIRKAQLPRENDFLARPIGPGDAKRISALAELSARWQELSGPDRYRELEGLLRRAVGSRYVFVQKENSSGRLVFREFGDGLFDHIKPWRVGAVGQPIDQLPDRHYGRWVAESYVRTLASGRPHVDDVDAIVNWPHRGRSRLRYKRLIVPLDLASDQQLLLGGSIVDDAIDLRVSAS